LKLRGRSRHLLAVERPYCDSPSASTPAATIPAAGHSNYAKYGSHGTGSPILDALLPPTVEAWPLGDFQRLRLYLDNPSLHLPENGLAFLKAKTDLFRSDTCSFPVHLCHQPPLQNAACETRLHPYSEFHQPTPLQLFG